MVELRWNKGLDADTPFFIVMNPGAGQKDGDEACTVIGAVLSQASRKYTILRVEKPEDLQKTAQRAVDMALEERGVVVAVGGDGTINTVAQAVLGAGCPFGVLPQGTFNYFGRTHGISQKIEEAISMLLDSVVRPVQVGMINERLFLVNASLGLYPELLEDREIYKHRYGRHRVVALLSGLATLMRSHQRMDVELEYDGDRRRLRTPTLFIGNNALQLRRLGVSQSDEVEQGKLLAIALKDASFGTMVGLLLRGAWGRLGVADNLIEFSFQRLTVHLRSGRASKRVKIATDGEIMWLSTPLVFKVAAEPLPLLMPRSKTASESA